jgi:two-component system sensor kinase FixL
LILDADPPALGEVREILADIRSDDQRAADIIRRMRSLLQRHEIVRTPIGVNRMVEEILRLVTGEAVARKVVMKFEPVEGEPRVAGDRVHLQQVLLNLVLNGFDAMAAIPVDQRRMIVRTSNGDDRTVRIAVSDSGPGIAADSLPDLFKPFYTTKEDGLGMGLSITRTIVDAHHGRVWAENNPDAGATFYVTLPLLGEGET